MEIEFGKLIDDYETKEIIAYWYDECVKTLIRIFNDSNVKFSTVYEDKFEKVFLINDEAFVYAGIVIRKYSSREFNQPQKRSYAAIAGYVQEKRTVQTNELLICGLNYNSFKGIHRSIFHDVSRNSAYNGWIGYPDLVVDFPYFSDKTRWVHEECLKHCSEKIKDYDLNQIVRDFDGAPYIIAIYKIENNNHEIGYATYCIDKIDKAHELARRCYTAYFKSFLNSNYPAHLKISDDFKNIFKNLYIVEGEPIADVKEIFKCISYTLIDVKDNPKPNVKKIYDNYKRYGVYEPDFGIEFLASKTLNEIKEGKLKPTNFYSFSDGRNKWKSEFLVYQIVSKLYPNQTIYQYHPFYLKTDKGRLSYDIFITGFNIAIEYQGKQHFEAVEFFGGDDSFQDNQRRDKLKKELSDRRGIKLIYINYDEDISEKLIKEKIYKSLNE